MPSSMAFSLVQTRKAWDTPYDSRPGGQVSSRAALTQPATAIQETGVGAAAWDGARRPQQTLRPTRRAGAVQRYQEGAHSQYICQVFSQARGRAGALGLPRHSHQPSNHVRPVLTFPSPALPEATRLACGLAWWHELWYRSSVA